MDIFPGDQGVEEELFSVQVLVVHRYGADLPVFIGGVVIDPFVCIAAGGVNGFFIFAVFRFTVALYLLNSSQNVEKLTDAIGLIFLTDGV
jgi:hypothetical protein